MNDVFDYTIPVLHPMIVHFPVAVLPVAAVLCVVWIWKRDDSWDGVVTWLLAFGAVGAISAFLTGNALYEQAEGVPVVELFVTRHRQLGRLVMIFAILAAVAAFAARVGGHRQKPKLRRFARPLSAVLAVVAAGLALITGHLGGLMVWGEFVGP